MTSAAPAVRPAAWANSSSVLDFFKQSAAIAEVELNKLLRDPTELLSRAVQPTLWLVIFGQVFSRVRGIPTGNVSYLAFMTPGILAQSVLFTAIFYGIAVIWERDLGIVHKLLVSPAERAALVVGKAISAGFRGAIQAGHYLFASPCVLRIGCAGIRFPLSGVLCARGPRIRDLLDVLPDHRLHREIARTLHGHRPGADDAAFLRQQRDLSAGADAATGCKSWRA